MPYVEGETLRQRLTREGRLSPAEHVRILKDVLDALIHAHRHGIVHRDIKPENIMLAGRHALVMDFGVAKALAESQDYIQRDTHRHGLRPGHSRVHVARAGGWTVQHRCPFRPLCGGSPGLRDAERKAALQRTDSPGHSRLPGHPRHPHRSTIYRPEPPPELAGIIMRSLEKDPEQRWSSAEEMLSRLEQLSVIRGGRLRKPRAGGGGGAAAADCRRLVRLGQALSGTALGEGRSHPPDAGPERGRRKREDLQPCPPGGSDCAG